MKKKFILFPLIAVLFYVVLASNATGPGVTSATDATTGGCSCHNTSATSTTGVTIQLKNGTVPVTTYVPGTTYTITLTGTQGDGSLSLPRFGFQTEVVNSGGSTVGTLTAPAGTHTVTVSGNTLVEHSSPLSPATGTGGSGTTYVMNIPWTAPASGAGGLTLKGVINAVNFNTFADGGDKWNNTTSAVSELLATTGNSPICIGSTITLSNTTTGGGTWSTASGAVSVSGTTGSTAVITGVSAATATVTYAAGGNITTTIVTVNAFPTVTGSSTACVGGTTTLTGSPSGGTWLSGATGTATVSSSGVVTGVAGGTAAITYTATTGCQKVTTVTINTVPVITGTAIVCEGSTTTLFNSTSGGTWTSSLSATASVGASSGIVTGVAAGTATITYTVSAGCATTAVVTVNPSPAAIAGTLTVCSGGGSTTLSNSVGGGTWSSSDGSRATIGPSTGIVNGVAAGTSTISYSLSTGCRATAVLTVNPTPASITGAGTACTGLTSTLSSTSAGGTWTSSDGSTASIDPSTGVVTGGSVGTATITYTLPGGCFATSVFTVTALPAAISGIMSICPSTTSTLSTTPTGGTWSSSTTSVATIGSASGVLSGVAAGTSSITYTLSAGCVSTATITVNPLPSPITGTAAVCVGSMTTLSSVTGGGTWVSSNSNASIDAGGVVMGVTPGTAGITYTLPTGCVTTTIVTVNVTPVAISGTGEMCVGLTTTLSNSTGGGTWNSAATGVASIGLTSGIATGISAGTATISYILGTGCFNTTVVTVNALPAGIVGSSAVCVGSAIVLTDATSGGTWSSASSTVSVDATTGQVTGVSAGSATITYTLPTSCRVSTTITVNPLPAALTGASTVCVGSNATVIAPTGGGTWASSNTAAATINAAGVMTGIAPGTTLISYTLPTGCMRTITATVNPLPGSNSGTAVICAGATTNLTNGTPGGTWSSSSTTVATVGVSSGIVTGAASGTTTITYMLPTGCIATSVVTVNPLPNAGVISGPATLCASSTTALSSSASGGVWSSGNLSVATISASGVVSGVSAGTVTISYTVTNSCGTAVATKVMTITLTASAGTISGSGTVCIGGTTILSSTAGGGTWTSSNASVASVVAATGMVSGVTAGTATISYIVTGSCGSAVATTVITVNPSPSAISGPSTVCEGSTIVLSDAGGGTWTSSDVSVATVGSSTGIVTGGTAGVVTITYTLPTGCDASKAITVNPIPSPISGLLGVCLGSTTALTNPTPGGTWSSSNTAVASVVATTGVVTGVAAGTASISYILATGCAVSAGVTVNITPATITGIPHACVGTSTTLGNTTGGGTWSSSNVLVATASGASGVITGTSPGTSTITYQLPTGCFRTTVLTVDATPSAITGGSNVCSGRPLALADATPGGVWSSSNTAIATIGSLSGIATGVSGGSATISYLIPATGCAATMLLSVNTSPSAITGSPSVCTGSATTLASTTPGGIWSSSNTTVAGVVTTSGVVVPVSLGTSIISYTIANGCSSTVTVTVNALPAPIIGSSTVCVGTSTTLSNTSAGGIWTSSDVSVAVVSTSLGSVLGVTTGTTTISYTLPTGCSATTIMTVEPAPGPITGGGNLCTGSTITLSSSATGGTWASSNVAVAPVGLLTGIVTGASIGSATISYTLPTGCITTLPVTVNAAPAAIAGPAVVCAAATITLTDATGGGSWTSSATSTATVGSASGVVTGVAAGVATITYVMPTGCIATKAITVNSLPVAGTITGPAGVCVGSTITLTDPVPGGVWSASSGHATVTAAGIVTGVSGGLDTIMYSVTNACTTVVASYPIVVNELPNAGTISGLLNMCVGGSSMLTTSGSGGTWIMTGTVASVSSGGIVSGLTPGTATVSYSVINGCGTAVSTATITVLNFADAGTVTGADSVCIGSTIHVSTTATGGIWAASNTSATVSATGDVTGVLPGSVTVMYIVINSCNVDTAAHTVYVKTAAQCVNSVVSAPLSGSISLYPNPSSGSFAIDLPASVANGQVTITDITGKVVWQSELSDISNSKVVVTLPDVAAGTYLVRIDSDGRSFRQKVMIVR